MPDATSMLRVDMEGEGRKHDKRAHSRQCGRASLQKFSNSAHLGTLATGLEKNGCLYTWALLFLVSVLVWNSWLVCR